VLLRRALAEPPTGDPLRLLVECRLAEANAGEPGWYAHMQEAIETAADPRARAAVALTTAQALLREQRPDEAVRVIDGAAEGLGGGDPRVAALLEAMAVAAGMLDARLAPGVAERAEALRRRVEDDPESTREVLAVAAFAAAFANEPAETGADLARRALRASPRRIPDPADLPSTWFSLATIVLVWAEQYAEAAELLNAAVRECRAAGAGGNLATALTYRAWLALRRGDLRGAEVDARTGVEAADLPLPLLYRLIASGILVSALVERGARDDAARALAAVEAWAEMPAMGPATLRLARARLRMAQGRTEEALADYLAVGEVASRSGVRSPSILPWRSEAAVAQLVLGDRAAALGLAEEDLALARGFGTPSALGLALRAAGLATGGRRGEELLRNAVDVLAGSEARVEQIRAQTDLGAHLRRANRRAEAREHLRAALDAAHRTGAGALATRAETELRATGARPRSRVLSGLDSLTASERRVADLASEGMTNREIAQALFVTARTVEGHLTQAFRKLDVSSRDELASALGAPGA
jgi:DNA-binding CsgD family transcriptional regulator